MPELKLDIDLTGIKLGEEEQQCSPTELSTRILNSVINAYGNQQLPGKHYHGFNKANRKLLYELTDQFEEAKKGKLASITISEDIAKFIKRCFRDSTFIPNELVMKVERNVEAM